ncbi:MAG TPA: hypothetical protein VFL81_00550 [Candidatus Saccharimonadales bacterium]|nr:hypothetical protein [Candidatus Saccharimonadales bacterium]
MREVAFGLVKMDLGQLIVALVVAGVGLWLLNGGRAGAVRAIAGAFLSGVGLFAVLMSIWVVDYRWINTLLAVIALIAIGIALARAAGVVTTVLGIIVILIGVAAIDQLSIFGNIHLNGALRETFHQAHRMWNRNFS